MSSITTYKQLLEFESSVNDLESQMIDLQNIYVPPRGGVPRIKLDEISNEEHDKVIYDFIKIRDATKEKEDIRKILQTNKGLITILTAESGKRRKPLNILQSIQETIDRIRANLHDVLVQLREVHASRKRKRINVSRERGAEFNRTSRSEARTNRVFENTKKKFINEYEKRRRLDISAAVKALNTAETPENFERQMGALVRLPKENILRISPGTKFNIAKKQAWSRARSLLTQANLNEIEEGRRREKINIERDAIQEAQRVVNALPPITAESNRENLRREAAEVFGINIPENRFTNEPINKNLPIPNTMWDGFTRGDVDKLRSVFDTSRVITITRTSTGRIEKQINRPYRETYAVCPVCLTYVDRGEACLYIQDHNCKREAETRGDGLYHHELYHKYKDPATGKIVFCAICSRICNNAPEAHLELAKHDAPKARLTGKYADPFGSDKECLAMGGGGFREKIIRYNALRNKALELNKQIGKISKYNAFKELVETMWDAPLNPPRKLKTTRFNTTNRQFPTQFITSKKTRKNHTGNSRIVIPRDSYTTPTIIPGGGTIKNYSHINDDSPLIQFHHLDGEGNINHHETQPISKDGLIGFINQQPRTFRCYLPSCNGYLHPNEIKKALYSRDAAGRRIFEISLEDRQMINLYERDFNSRLRLANLDENSLNENIPSLNGFFADNEATDVALSEIEATGSSDMLHEATDAACKLPPRDPDGGGAGGASYPPGWPGRGGIRKNTKRRSSNRKKRSTRRR